MFNSYVEMMSVKVIKKTDLNCSKYSIYIFVFIIGLWGGGVGTALN